MRAPAGVSPVPGIDTEDPAMTDEQQIRDLIQRWASAVHDGDLPAVLADHAPGIVMFDVPPPEQGVRGIDAYRDTWPGFFEWQASGAVFEIESLDVTAGAGRPLPFSLLPLRPAPPVAAGPAGCAPPAGGRSRRGCGRAPGLAPPRPGVPGAAGPSARR